MPCFYSTFRFRVTILKGKMAILGVRVTTFRAKMVTWEVGALWKSCEAR